MISVPQEAMGQAEEETEDEYIKAVSGGNLQSGTTRGGTEGMVFSCMLCSHP
jgi:hypothetical protein